MDSVYHPIQRDRATFLETAAATKGARSLIEVELAPGGGNAPHYHTDFEEHFRVVSGHLNVEVAGAIAELGPGDEAVAPARVIHRFFNPTDAPAVFRVELTPGHGGFENALRIAYGLAQDGRVNRKGIPSNLSELAVLVTMAGTYVTGPLGYAARVFSFIASTKRGARIRERLIERYCSPLRGF
ncbi:MAG TPA: cupin domain-containing protein [Chloroflexota bacterium]|nr:cupin domain-containing protein [Chloroflexota bacterium]